MSKRDIWLAHHGIKGQKWGVKNGPPYPLDSQSKSTSEKRATTGRRNSNGENEKKGLSDRQKKAIKIGAAACATALAAAGTYYLYKNGYLDKMAEMGKNKTKELLAGSADIINFGDKASSITSGAGGTIKKLAKPEPMQDTLSKANPLRGTPEGKNNCVPSAIAGFLRQMGYDVTAKGTGGKMQNTAGVVEECFKGAKVLEGSAVKFGRSRADAVEMLVKHYGLNAEGVDSVDLKRADGTTGGHCFSWKITNGIVSFFDNNTGRDDSQTSKYFNIIDTNGQLVLARLDDLEIDMNAISKYVSFD